MLQLASTNVFPGAVAVLTLCAAVVVPFVILRLQRRRKALSYEIRRLPLVSVRAEAAERIAVLFENKPVKGVALITLRFRNSGNAPVRASDFDGPLTVALTATTVLETTVQECVPDELGPVVSQEVGALTVAPLLLNPGDSFELALLVDGPYTTPVVTARIAGVSRVTPERAPTPASGYRLTALVASLGILTVGLAVVAAIQFSKSPASIRPATTRFDHKDPVTMGCARDAVDVSGSEVPVYTPTKSVVGIALLRHSSRCHSSWGLFRAYRPIPSGNVVRIDLAQRNEERESMYSGETLVLESSRIRVEGQSLPNGGSFYGNQLDRSHGCIEARIEVVGKVTSRGHTPCL
jgi:Protein of unknown function (DUF2690)